MGRWGGPPKVLDGQLVVPGTGCVSALLASGSIATGMACGSLLCHSFRARSRKRLPWRWHVTMTLDKMLWTKAPSRFLLQPPTLRVITAARSICSAWLFVGCTSGSCRG